MRGSTFNIRKDHNRGLRSSTGVKSYSDRKRPIFGYSMSVYATKVTTCSTFRAFSLVQIIYIPSAFHLRAAGYKRKPFKA